MTFEPKAVPFLKWAGGKKNFVPMLAPAISTYLVGTGGHYVEPFVGGGAMMLALDHKPMIINDVIEDLTQTYTAVRDSAMEVALLLCELREFGTDEKSYYAVRASIPDTDVETAARMIYLNAQCFNGIWRENKSGLMNVPYGKKENKVTDALIDRIGAASEALQDIEIFNGDFEPVVKKAEEGDLLYVDPPYDGTYVGYSEGGFCGVSQDRLASELYQAHLRGAAFICHNSDTEKVRSWYDYATLVDTKEARSVNRDAGGRGKAPCLLITNRPDLLVDYLIPF